MTFIAVTSGPEDMPTHYISSDNVASLSQLTGNTAGWTQILTRGNDVCYAKIDALRLVEALGGLVKVKTSVVEKTVEKTVEKPAKA